MERLLRIGLEATRVKVGWKSGPAAALEERTHTACAEASLALRRIVGRVRYRLLSGNGQSVVGTEDMKAAYRQIPVAEAHQRHAIAVMW